MVYKRKLLFGVGINDADYIVKPRVNGVITRCPYYVTWYSMLTRCYSKKYQSRSPTYAECTVCEDWLTFSKFKAWMETQDWCDKQLDKDLLFYGNKLYSPETCAFVNRSVNSFLTDGGSASRGEYMIGVSYHKASEKFRSQCGSSKRTHLGLFNTELEAHLAWKAYKHKLACEMADQETDSRIAEALRTRYL